MTAVSYIRNVGGPISTLSALAETIWACAYRHNIQVHAKHLAGYLNTEADRLSHPAAPLRVDDGASLIQTNRLHFRPPFSRSLRIYDYNPPPEIQFSLTSGVDALAQQDWGSEINFVNAPFRLLNRVLDVIIAQ